MKFNINLSPVCGLNPALTIEKLSSSLIISGVQFDFSFLADGDTLPRSAIQSDVICSDVSRIDDVIHITVRLPHGPDAPESVRFPQPILVTQDGPITLPGDAHVD